MSSAGEHLRESKDALAEVFRNPGLRRVNVALVGSVIGDWAYAVAVSVYAYNEGGATAVGVLGTIRYITIALFLPFTSVLADKFDRKLVMIGADVSRFVLVVAAAAVIEFDGPSWVVYALAIVTSIASTPFRPAQQALLPKLATHPGELTAANVASSTIESAGFFIGPAIGAFLLVAFDVAAVYMFNAVTFLWSAFVVLGLHVPKAQVEEVSELADEVAEETGEKKGGGPFSGVGAGYREIFRNRDIRLLVLLYCAQTIVAGASLVFTVAVALDLLNMEEAAVGMLDSALGVGGLLGGVLALILSRRGKLARDFGIGVIMWAAPLLLIAFIPELASALIAMWLIGMANSVVDVNADTIMQRLIPDEVMGRVFGAVNSAIIGAMAIGALLMPILIETVGLRTGLAVIGFGVIGLVVLGAPGLQRIDKVTLAPVGLDLLRGVPMLARLPDALIERLARFSSGVNIPAGQPVFSEGDAGDRFYVIESGTVEVTIRGEHIRDLGPGDSFGEIALMRDIPRTATVVATSDLVTRAIERQHFLPAVTGHGAARDEAETVVNRLMAIV
ncbi:MAG TPA: MFS transporter [Ilumatobacteraceae bacterium]|nr:MFS transporter [Ilumatobacteraceae bacterium]